MAESEGSRVEQPFNQEVTGVDPIPERDFIRIATWDIEWFPAGLRNGAAQNVQWQTAAVTGIIRELNPDILVTQENRNLAALKQLNSNMGSRGFSHLASSWYGAENLPSKLNENIQQQCGVLSQHPWSELWEVDFASLKKFTPPARGWLGVRFNIRGLQFVLYNAFLPGNFMNEDPARRKEIVMQRELAIDELKRDFDRLGLDPYRDKIIVLGNFNADYFDSSLQDEKTFDKLINCGFQHSWGTETRNNIITRPAQSGDTTHGATLDYIWFSSAWGDSLPDARVLSKGAPGKKGLHGGDEPGLASEHYPVWVDLPLKK